MAQLIPDHLWEQIAPLLPTRPASQKGGRPPIGDREVLTGIIFVLNLSVSFTLALAVALRARAVPVRDWLRLPPALLRRFLRRPGERHKDKYKDIECDEQIIDDWNSPSRNLISDGNHGFPPLSRHQEN